MWALIRLPCHWYITDSSSASYFIFISMLFDAVDGRLARLTRHTTDFGGQLDSLADVVSFGFAPMAVALKLFHDSTLYLTSEFFRYVSRTVWCIGALYLSCAMIRLARFNVSNKHGEEHHFSFLGLPSPGAAAVVASFILMQQDLLDPGDHTHSATVLRRRWCGSCRSSCCAPDC